MASKKKKKSFSEQVISGSYESSMTREKVAPALKKTNESMKKAKAQEKSFTDGSLLSAFDDGYNFGDVTKTILKGGAKLGKAVYNTGKEVVTNPVQSVKTFGVGVGEGVNKASDLVDDAVGDFFDWIVPGEQKKKTDGISVNIVEMDKFSKTASKEEKQKVLKEYEKEFGKDDPLYKSVEVMLTSDTKEDKNILNAKYYDTDTYKKAVEGELSKGQENIYSVGENVGQMLPSVGVSMVAGPVAGSSLFFTQSQQSYTEEALNRGYDEGEARTYGLIMGGAEVLVERLGFDELGGLSKLSNASVKKAMVGEGLEEFVMPYVDDVVTYVGFEDGYGWEEFGESTEEALEGAVMGATVGAIMNAGGRGLTKVDTFIEKVNSGQEITQEDIVQAGKEIQKNAPELLEEAMKGVPETVKREIEAQKVTSEDIAVQEDIAPVGDMTQQLEQDNIPIMENNVVQQAGQQDIAPVNEAELKRTNYTYQASDTDSQITLDLKESASRVMNDTKRSHEFVETVSKIAERTQTRYKFTNTEELNALGYKVEGKRVNGLVTKDGEILINIDSQKALNTIVGHETTHLLEGTKEYKALQDAVFKYAQTKGDYAEVSERLGRIYSGQKNVNIDNELTSELIGDYLFTDQKFLNNLSAEQPGVFKKIYNEIKHWINMATAGSKEARQLEDLKHKFEKALNNKQNAKTQVKTNETKQTTTQETKDKSVVEVESNTQEKEKQVTKVEEITKETKEEATQEIKEEVQEKPKEEKVVKKAEKKTTTPTQEELDSLENTRQNKSGSEYALEFFALRDKYGEANLYKGLNNYKSTGKALDQPIKEYSLSEDNKGRTLTKEQQDFFKDSKVRDENGNLLTMYHGTSSGGHTIFDPYGGRPGLFGQGSYFTADNTVAESYTEKGRGNNKQIYEVYLNITNPIDMDAQANVEEWKQHFSKHIPEATFPESGTNEALYRSTLEEFENTEYDRVEVAEIMVDTFQKMGYDGITHIGGGRFNQKDNTRHRVYITFESNQIKEVTNKNPTEDSDIRYSLSESTTDNQGRELSKEQQEFFKDSKVRDEDGRLLEVYHGTPYGGFTEFKDSHMGSQDGGGYLGDGFYFTNDYEYAKDFTDELYMDEYTKANAQPGEYGNPKVYETYIDIKKPYIIKESDVEYDENTLSNAVGTSTNYEATYKIKQQGYDGIIYEFEGGTKEYLIFNSKQVKVVDNANPTANDDIRYSLSENKKEIYVYHGTSHNSAMRIKKYGLIPSSAIGSTGIKGDTGSYNYFTNNLKNAESYKTRKDAYTGKLLRVKKTADMVIDERIVGHKKGEYDFRTERTISPDEIQIQVDNGKWTPISNYDLFLDTPIEERVIDKSLIYDDDISYSLSEETVSEKTQRAIDTMGTTTNMKVAGYLTTDGQFIDFSGKHYGARGDRRQMDHREIADIYTDEEYDIAENKYSNMGTATAIMQDFIDEGNIRTTGTGVDISAEPTKAQYDKLYDYLEYVQRDNGEVYIDLETETKNRESLEYGSRTSISKMIKDIKEHYSKYSLSELNEDIAPTGDYNVYGSEVGLQQQVEEVIAPLQEQVQELTKVITDLQENIAPASFESAEEQRAETQRTMSDEDAPLTEEGTFSFYDEEVQIKNKSEIVKEIQEDFNIRQSEARELYNKIASIPEVTVEDIYTELENYRQVKIQEQDDYQKSIQSYIKGTKLDISEIKNQITDYNNTYRMTNMGKGLILGNSGQSIDSFYQELSELYPNDFPSNVTAEADQLDLISQAMFKDTAFTYTNTLDNDELQILAERIYSDIENTERYKHSKDSLYFLNRDVKKMAPPGELNTDTSQEEYLKSLPDTLDESYAPYLEMARELNASNTEKTYENASLIEELNRLDTNRPEEAKTSENEPKIAKNVYEEMMDNFINRGKTNKTPVQRIEKSKMRNAVDTGKRLFVNEMAETDNIARETGNLDIKFKGDMLNAVAGEIEGEIYVAQTDNEGHQIGSSLSSLFAEAKETDLYEPFNHYLELQSNIDRHKQGKGSKVSLTESEQLVKQYENTYPQFKEWGKGVWWYGENIRNNLVDAGLITREFSEKLGEMYPHYVPYIEQRDVSNYYPDLGEIKAKSVIKRAKGGASNLLPIEESLAKYTFASKKAVRQNQFYQELVKTLDDKASIGADVRSDATDLETSLYRDETGNYLTAYFNGQQQSVRISDDLYNGLKNDLKYQIEGLEQKFAVITDPVQKISEVRRNLLTSWNPMFIIRNPIMDVQDAVFNSKYTKDFVKNYPKSFVELSRANTETAKQFLTLYGSGNVMGEFSSDGRAKNSNFLKGIQKANNIMELAPRYAEFKASIENGASVQEAMYNAREVTTNFSRGGTITKALNKNGFTFLNVSVQGFDKFIRNFSGENGAKGVAGALLKASIFGVLPAVFNEMAFGGDDEEKDEDYDALPDYIKDNYYLIKTGDGEFIRIPKGRILSVFGSAGRRTLEYMQGEEDAFEGFLKNANSQIGVTNPLDSNILTPLFQAYGSENGEAWYGGDIVPSRLQDKAPEEQYDASTDRFSIWLGDKLKNVPIIGDKIASPYKINYVLDQYSGGIGDIFLPFITEEATSDSEGAGMLLAPIKDAFTSNSTFDNKYAGDIYDLSDKLDKLPSATKETDDYKIQDAYLYSITSEMGKLYAERREVQGDSTLSKSEKYAKAKAIQEQINSLAKEGLDNYQNVSKTDNYAIVGGREFNKYVTDDGEERWGKVFDNVLEDLNSMGMDLDEKSEYFKATKTISEVQSRYTDSNDYVGKKRDVIGTIKSSNLNDEQKAYLYDKYYGNTEVVNAIVTIGVDFDEYLDYESQNFEADKDSSGKSISGSKKAKVFAYINSMNIDFEQRVILAKLQYNSYHDYNREIVEYLNNSDLTYEEEEVFLKKLGFKVDANGNIRW